MYWPCFGTLRGKFIPEDSRATIMNFFRVPVNLFVVVVLLKVSSFHHSTIFIVCSSCLFVALILAQFFANMTANIVEKEPVKRGTPKQETNDSNEFPPEAKTDI